MFYKKFYFILIACFILNADGRKFRRSKRPKPEDDSTPQPNVVTYSNFGFNDVGSYDGFVPSSPDYVNQLSTFNPDSATRLYAPAFPTALDDYPSPTQNEPFNLDEVEPQASEQYPQSSVSFITNPGGDGEPHQPQYQNVAPEIYGRNSGDPSAPIYGTKLGSRTKGKHLNHFNNSDTNLFSSPSENKYSFHEVPSAYESKPSSFAEASKNNYQFAFNYATTHPTSNKDEDEEYLNSALAHSQSNLKFPKVVDFTNLKKYYPNDFSTSTTKAPNTYKAQSNIQNENSFFKEFEEFSTQFPSLSSNYKDQYNKGNDKGMEKEPSQPSFSYSSTSYGNVGGDYSPSFINYPNSENSFKDTKLNLEQKDKYKYNSWPSSNFTNDFKSWRNPIKGYQYSTNVSNMNFEFDYSGSRRTNSSKDEVVPASSNIVDFTDYQFPDTDYSTFKKFPSYKGFTSDDHKSGFESFKPQEYKYDPEEYVKSLYSSPQASSATWGSNYKSPEFSSFKQYKKPTFGEDIGDDIVHIPKRERPHGTKFAYGSKPTEWSSYTSHKPHKPKKPSASSSWNKEVSTRFKSEEDLLGLRTHDTSHPAYLPTYKPEINSLSSDFNDYKKLVEKWRQSYLRSKYKDAGLHDFEGYPSDTKAVHVPIPKPYPIEVPHPVIVPVPQPYPVRVPIPKPVAVPVVRELSVPVEKPVPYPVYKNVPYPVEKPVPVPVEKEVKVPVMKPYPVPIPHIRPVFHHSRPKEMDTIDEDDDYFPRPERERERESSKKNPYAKRPRSTRNRTRRPSRTYERNRRRWPTRRPAERPRRPEVPVSYKHYERDFEDFEHSHSEYILHCKRTGNC